MPTFISSVPDLDIANAKVHVRDCFINFCAAVHQRDTEGIELSLSLHEVMILADPDSLRHDLDRFKNFLDQEVPAAFFFEHYITKKGKFASLARGVDVRRVVGDLRQYLNAVAQAGPDVTFGPPAKYWLSKRTTWPAAFDFMWNVVMPLRLSNASVERCFSMLGKSDQPDRRHLSFEKRKLEVFYAFNGPSKHWPLPRLPASRRPSGSAAPSSSAAAAPTIGAFSATVEPAPFAPRDTWESYFAFKSWEEEHAE